MSSSTTGLPSTSSVQTSNTDAISQMEQISNAENAQTIATAQIKAQQDETQGLSSLITGGASGIKSAAAGQ
ncbi:MAG: hypothetical protein QOI13_1532 [Paraburkholderia sp.]|jgi:hypothetical protein|nr:hypothetical protein [Paraburkholderia sp.]MEA3121807.1 hypothetical protein [Paraburkholderia sp.]